MHEAGEQSMVFMVFTIDLALKESADAIQSELGRLRSGNTEGLYKFLGVAKPESIKDSQPFVSHVVSGYERILGELQRYQHGGICAKDWFL